MPNHDSAAKRRRCQFHPDRHRTPGQIVSAVAVLDEIAAGIPSHVTGDLAAPVPLSDLELRERMSGNICRCAAYPNIIAAIRDVAGDRT
jgi:xanthine dehydrogenase YagT iron-sulfur-binding subunit